jgi:hypothetical protein
MLVKISASTGSAAALVAILFMAGEGQALAAPCPFGEIYRPSRGICISKDVAIQAGIYRQSASPLVVPVITPDTVRAIPLPPPRPRFEALAAIERRAPAVRATAAGALAFVRERTDATVARDASPKRPEPSSPAALLVSRPVISPYGSLVPLEPQP